MLSAPLSPGQGLQLPLAGPGQVLESLRQRAPPAAQPQPNPDHTLCPALSPTVGAPQVTGQVWEGRPMPTEQMVLVPEPLSRAVALYSPILKAGFPPQLLISSASSLD